MSARTKPLGSPVSIQEMLDHCVERLVRIDNAIANFETPAMVAKWRRWRDIDEATVLLLMKIQMKNPGLTVAPFPASEHPEDAAP